MRIAVVRQRYNPYGGAERFVIRALDRRCPASRERTNMIRAGGDRRSALG